MKKILLAGLFLTLFSSVSYSEESQIELKQAPKEYVLAVLKTCQEYAVEDEIEKDELAKYLLSCVNDELESEDYFPIKVLPKI